MRRSGVALGLLAGALAPAATGRAAPWALPLLDAASALAVVARGGAVELALYVPDAPADAGRRLALLRRGVDPAGEPAWQRARQQAVCPLGATLAGEGEGWVRVRVEHADALERALASERVAVPLSPPEVVMGETPIQTVLPALPASWGAPAFSCDFARGQREARWLYGDWDGDGVQEVGKYLPARDVFLLDANGNGVWDGVAGGDRSAWLAAAAGPGEPLVGDWDGDGAEGIGKAIGAKAYLDANETLAWEGVAGGDEAPLLAPGRPDAQTVVGDWDGDGRDQLGRYEAALGRFLLDANGDGRWDGVAGGDRRVAFFASGAPPSRVPSEPFVGDFDGARGDGVGLVASGRVRADLDENGRFEGGPGSERDLWAVWGNGELPPRPAPR